ncbi:uncharacterized protein LOC126733782 [Anthonomus grandis grandis]|uniref:uncharacterized protein LOC126733782 n=1 Tax=Anthonomus grandis grandis TaxID=2921223 RepID=UPI002165842A|nr:uncharacterized protein LOC126733782 [Anthonomus grandis grandis]
MKVFLVCLVLGISTIFAKPPFASKISINGVNLNASSGHDVIDGNCTNTTDADLVFKDYIHLHRVPFFTRSGKSEWHGDQKIYCVQALNQKSDETGGTANITEGGVGHNYVTIEMNSYVSHGIEFYIYVWAK